jgi:hypothetical protein
MESLFIVAYQILSSRKPLSQTRLLTELFQNEPPLLASEY